MTWRLGCAQHSATTLLQKGLVGRPAGTSAVLTDISCSFPRNRQASQGTKFWSGHVTFLEKLLNSSFTNQPVIRCCTAKTKEANDKRRNISRKGEDIYT